MAENLIEIRDLSVAFNGQQVVSHLSLDVRRGECLAQVGESGSGKSVTAHSILQLLPRSGTATTGSITYRGQQLVGADERTLRELRGNRIAMIFQEPMTALNPLATVGRQIAEMFVLHQGASWDDANKRAVEALASVKVPAPEERVHAYPHQMSGGMRQRVMIAIALACNPALLIADEPTTALDVTVQAEVLRLIAELCSQRGTAVLLISHDLGVIANICQRVGVMYGGKLVEERDTYDLFSNPRHAYTQGLLGALPRLGSRQINGRQRLVDIDSLIQDRARLTEAFYSEPRHLERNAHLRAAQSGGDAP